MTAMELLQILQREIHSTVVATVDEMHCLHCGNCFRVCPVKAVEKLGA